MYKVNDKVVYPGHGVAVVQEIVKKNVAGSTSIFFKLTFPYKEMTVLVPKGRFESSGIRSLSNDDEIKLATVELHAAPRTSKSGEVLPAGWSRRHREYQIKIQQGSLVDIASIYRDLMYTSQRKELSFGEKSLMQMTEDLLSQEISTVRGCKPEDILGEIRSPFGKSEPVAEKTVAPKAEQLTL